MLTLDTHDQVLVAAVQAEMAKAIGAAHNPVAVAKRISVVATGYRNKGRNVAIRKYPFKGVCEVSGQPLERRHAELDEMEPELGYAGKLRWVCQVANNSGKHSHPLAVSVLQKTRLPCDSL
jgi:hypothetical protein